jgi:hypothetical protein
MRDAVFEFDPSSNKRIGFANADCLKLSKKK